MRKFPHVVPLLLTVALTGSSLDGCSSESGSGTVTGQLPLCYGPGPDTNLWPKATIETLRDGKAVRTDTFPSNLSHRTYSLLLPSGHYELHLQRQPDSRYTLSVAVEDGKRTRADFPSPGCL